MNYFKEKSYYLLFIFLFLALFIMRPQFVYSQFDTDTDPPYIAQTSPENGDINVPVDTTIKVIFSEFMDTDNPFTINPFSINPYIDGDIRWELDQTLIFSPAMLLEYSMTYYVTIDNQAMDLSGKSLEDPYQWSFFTESSPWLHFYDIQGLNLYQNNIKLIFGADNGDIWVVLSSTVSSDALFLFNGFDPSDFHEIDESLGLINAIDQDGAGNIWVASESDDPGLGGIHVFDGTNWTHYNSNTNSIFSDNIIKCLTINLADNIWAGSSYSGIYLFDGLSWMNYNTNNSGVPSDWITAIYADENDYIWFSTPFGSIEGLDQQTNTWTSYTSSLESQLNISLPLVRKLLAGSGKIWATTNLGLLSYDIAAEQWDLYTQIGDYPLDEDRLNALALDSLNDILWVGTNEGLITFDGMNGNPIVLGDIGPEVLELAVDAYGNKWIGTKNSLSRYDTEPPLLLSFSPSANKKNVSRTSNIVLTFSESMDMESVINALSISPSIPFTSSKDSSSTALTLTPKSKLNDNKKYTVTVGKTATDIQGHPLTKSYSWSFTTEKTTKDGGGITGFTSTYGYSFLPYPISFPSYQYPSYQYPSYQYPSYQYPSYQQFPSLRGLQYPGALTNYRSLYGNYL